ncbi:RNA polymerase sigma factor [Falsibacillus pallidus]|uniref:RNA polymerase sigma factor (Sigma-70 family) n=1 Tax=Falsibacillus pallidus TaxID=493781 RepID=A0A370G5Z3_9BACI|nr:sigma-70 family RNA polymerase sigma factor [Falsibacillus pallidus]RDI38476.1 RNA polymerase sigma factor (sigma-70 family) [Falsibacillus pallidus]
MDQALIEQVLTGNEEAFRIIIEHCSSHVFQTVNGILRNQKDTEDAVQEVFVKIYTSLPDYNHQGFKTWITRIAVNHAIDIKRKHQRKKEDLEDDMNAGQFEKVQSESIESYILRKEKNRIIKKRIEELPENYREVVQGFYIQEKSCTQLAKEMDLQEKTIEMKLYRARKWIRNHWKEDDFS